jgi:hypothetical protein
VVYETLGRNFSAQLAEVETLADLVAPLRHRTISFWDGIQTQTWNVAASCDVMARVDWILCGWCDEYFTSLNAYANVVRGAARYPHVDGLDVRLEKTRLLPYLFDR